MSLSAERVAVANEAILRTFARSSIAWQAIPHWDTGDRAQSRVRSDRVRPVGDERPGSYVRPAIPITPAEVTFWITVGQATAPTPDALLGAVIAGAVTLARKVDAAVLPGLVVAPAGTTTGPAGRAEPGAAEPEPTQRLLDTLLAARGRLEDNGYHAPSCLVASTTEYRRLNTLVGGVPVLADLLKAADVGCLHRSTRLDAADHGLVMLGRRQDIPPGGAAGASAGEEPVDLAVSVPPSLEVVGETVAGEIELAARIRYALRVKDAGGVTPVNPPAGTDSDHPG